MNAIEAGWEIGFPAGNPAELLLALVVRDLVHGASFDVESVDDGTELALDYVAGDEIEGEEYRLLLSAEIQGTENREMIQAFTEEMLEGLVDEAQELLAHQTELGSREIDALEFRAVPEDEERWDLVAPDWLAPDGSEVPFGFRPFEKKSGDPWPGNPLLDRHGRVVLIPFEGLVHAVGIPAPTGWGEEEHGQLPVHPTDG
jgi:hypothetical protein